MLNTPTFWTSIALGHTARVLEIYVLYSQTITLDVFLKKCVCPDHWQDSVSISKPHACSIFG